MASAAGREVIGGAPIKKNRRLRRPQIDGGGGAAAWRGRRRALLPSKPNLRKTKLYLLPVVWFATSDVAHSSRSYSKTIEHDDKSNLINYYSLKNKHCRSQTVTIIIYKRLHLHLHLLCIYYTPAHINSAQLRPTVFLHIFDVCL